MKLYTATHQRGRQIHEVRLSEGGALTEGACVVVFDADRFTNPDELTATLMQIADRIRRHGFRRGHDAA